MSYPHMHMALAHERQDTLLAEARAARLASQARSHRSGGAPAGRRSPRRWALAWLPPARSRPLTSRPGPGTSP